MSEALDPALAASGGDAIGSVYSAAQWRGEEHVPPVEVLMCSHIKENRSLSQESGTGKCTPCP